MTDANVLEYTYNSDKLKSYDGNLCEYDALGNPTLYRNKSLEWNTLRNLAKYDTIEFTYNANGIRTKKVNGNNESKYYYLDSRLLSEKRDIHSSDLNVNDCLYEGEIYYTYTDKTDISYMHNANELTSFTIAKNGIHQTYYYRENLQGDITHIYDISGTLKAEYTYDAWGNHEIVTNVDNIANINPFRYRGYYYDTETNLYYLQSRYYDPQTGRFINADAISILDESKDLINGLNLFVYCNNNPVMFTDSSGQSWWSDFWKNIRNGISYFFNLLGKAANVISTSIFGFAVYGSVDYDMISVDTIWGGSTSGVDYTGLIFGNPNKPIVFYAKKASKWWRFWEYKIGIKANIGNGGFDIGLGIGEVSLGIDWGGSSIELFAGIGRMGFTLANNTDFKNGSFGVYSTYYFRPWAFGLAAILIYSTAGAIIPSLVPTIS